MIQAFLFDLNGTMIDDMQYHINAWHTILNDLGANISLEKMKTECYGKNVELLERTFPGRFNDAEKEAMSIDKEKRYQEAYMPELKLLPGLLAFLEQAKQLNVKMAIGSAAITYNVDFVLDNLNIRHFFDVVISGDDVVYSKPDPETYLKCAAALHIDAANCLVFEDVPKGVQSAANAGMQAVVITGGHIPEEFAGCLNVVRFVSDYNEIQPAEFLRS